MLDKSQAKIGGVVVGVFLVAGIALGLTGYIGMTFVGDAFTTPGEENPFGEMFVALVFVQSAIVTLFAGPLVATISGVVAGYSLRDRKPSIIVSGAGSFVGFFAMVSIAIFIMALGLVEASRGGSGDGGASFSGFGQLTSPMVKTAFPTTAAGIGAGILGTFFASD